MFRQFLLLVAMIAMVLTVPQLALAMGPTSAPMKNQGVRTATADPPAATTSKTYHHAKHRH